MQIIAITVQGTSGQYRVSAEANGVLYCTCPAWKFDKRPTHARECKHIRFARERLV